MPPSFRETYLILEQKKQLTLVTVEDKLKAQNNLIALNIDRSFAEAKNEQNLIQKSISTVSNYDEKIDFKHDNPLYNSSLQKTSYQVDEKSRFLV